MERIVLELDEKMKKKFKVYAAQNDMTVKDLLVEGALSYIKNRSAESYKDVAGGGIIKKK